MSAREGRLVGGSYAFGEGADLEVWIYFWSVVMWCVIVRWWAWSCGVLVLWLGGISVSLAALDSQRCKAHFRKKEYEKAASCFEILARYEPQTTAHLYNQALVLLRWAEDRKEAKGASACHLRLRALERLSIYEKKVAGDEQVRVAAQIRKLQTTLALGQLHVVSVPPQARLRLRGVEYERQAVSPFFFASLCPGRYSLEVESPGFSPLQTHVEMEGGRTQSHTFTLQALSVRLPVEPTTRPLPDLRRPSPLPPPPSPPKEACPRLLPSLLLFGAAALLVGGGGLSTWAARDAHQRMQDELPRSVSWKEHYQQTLAMEWTSGVFFASGGVAAVTGVILLFVLRQPCSTASPLPSSR